MSTATRTHVSRPRLAGRGLEAAEADRRRQLAAIHAAAAKAGMDTSDRSHASTYRSMLQAQAGVTSAAELDEAGRRKVLAYLQRLAGGPVPRPADGWQAKKMRQLWARLGELGALKDPSERGFNAFVLAQTQHASPRFLPVYRQTQLIEALKAWVARAEKKGGAA